MEKVGSCSCHVSIGLCNSNNTGCGSAGVTGALCVNCNSGFYSIPSIKCKESKICGQTYTTKPKSFGKSVNLTITDSESVVQRNINHEVTTYIAIRDEQHGALDSVGDNIGAYTRILTETIGEKSMIQSLAFADDWLTAPPKEVTCDNTEDHQYEASFHQSSSLDKDDLRNSIL